VQWAQQAGPSTLSVGRTVWNLHIETTVHRPQMLEWPMTDQRDLDGKRQLDYIDQDTSVGWAPILLGVAFVALLALLIFTSPSGPPSERPIISQKSELPNSAPRAPPVPTPAPPQPQ
jgi:hypothetical protein